MPCFDAYGSKDGRSSLEFSTGDLVPHGAVTNEAIDRLPQRLDVTFYEDSKFPGVTAPDARLVRFAETRIGLEMKAILRLDDAGSATLMIGTDCVDLAGGAS